MFTAEISSMYEKFTDRAQRVVILAEAEARILGHGYIHSEHILLSLIRERKSVAARVLESHGISLELAHQRVANRHGPHAQASPRRLSLSPGATGVLELSLREALLLGHNDFIGTGHLLLALIREGQYSAGYVLVDLGINLRELRQQIVKLLSKYTRADESDISGTPTGDTSAMPPILEQSGHNLTLAARAGEFAPIVGRDNEVGRIIQILGRRDASSPLLVGERGVGKAAVVHGLAAAMAAGKAGPFSEVNLYELDPDRLVDGALSQQDYEGRLRALADAVRVTGALLFIDDLDEFLRLGSGGGEIAPGTALKRMLRQGELRIIAAVTGQRGRSKVLSSPPMERAFCVVPISEPSVAQAVEILKSLRSGYEAHHRVTFSDEALVAVAELAERHAPDRFRPASAIDLLDEAGSRTRARHRSTPQKLSELDDELARIRREQDKPADPQNFAQRMSLRRQFNRLTLEKAKLEKKWLAGEQSEVIEVTGQMVEEIVAEQSTEPAQTPARRPPLAAPAPHPDLIDGDPEIWTMV
jgi:ATP-dependent Clp protease ATP-binding subunit ClpC